MNNKNIFLGIIFGAVILRVYFIFTSPYVSPDGVQYIRLGYHLWHDGVYSSGGAMFPDVIQPPLFPLLSGFFSLVLPPLIAGKLASMVAGILLILVVYRFLDRIGTPLVAAIGAGVTAFHPGLISVSSQAVTESWYLLFLALMLFDGWFFLRQPSFRTGFRVGLWIALGFITRPEMIVFGLNYVGFLIPAALFLKKRKVLIRSWVILLPAVAGILLYAGWVSGNLGYFTLSPKVNFVRIQSKLAGISRAGNPHKKIDDPKRTAYRAFYRLAPDSVQLMSRALLYKNPQALNWLNANRPASKKFKLKQLFRLLAGNAQKVAYKMVTGMGLPVILALLAAMGFFFLRERTFSVYLLWMCLPLAMYLFVHVEDRFLLGSWPMIVFPVSVTLEFFFKKVKRWLRPQWAMLVLFAVTMVFAGKAYQKMMRGFQASNEMQAVANQLKNTIMSPAVIVAREPQIIFFMDADFRVLPFASVPELLVYSQWQKADYLLFSDRDVKYNPRLSGIIQNPEKYMFSPVKKIKTSNHTYRLFHLKRKEGSHATKD